jgi:aconitase A
MTSPSLDSLNVRRTLTVGNKTYAYFSLAEAEKTLGSLARLPCCLKILMENLLRFEDGVNATVDDARALAARLRPHTGTTEISFRPARLLMEDTAALPALADLAALREAMLTFDADPRRINPLCPVDLIMTSQALPAALHSYDDRSAFLRWSQKAFDNINIAPPGISLGLANLERAAHVVNIGDPADDGVSLVYPDTFVSTSGGTTMINSLGVLGWAVGGIAAEAIMLNQPIALVVQDVVGVRLTGALSNGASVTELVLELAALLSKRGTNVKLVEFFGPGLDSLSVIDRAIIAALASEFGATCALFPIDVDTLLYLSLTNRAPDHIALIEAYAKEQGLWRESGVDDPKEDPTFTTEFKLDLSSISPPAPRLSKTSENAPSPPPEETPPEERLLSLEDSRGHDTSDTPITYAWNDASLTLRRPPFFESLTRETTKVKDIIDARLLAIFGDSVAADLLAPTGPIGPKDPAGLYLAERNVPPDSFGSYVTYNGNPEIVARGAFADSRLKNEIAGDAPGGMTKYQPSGAILPIYDAALRYQQNNVPLIIVAGKNYGRGLSHNEAAKGAKLLGVKAVIAESFDPRHRTDLIGMGVLPLTFKGEMTRADFELTGEETFNIIGFEGEPRPRRNVIFVINRKDDIARYMLLCRIDTQEEAAIYKNGGVLPYALRSFLQPIDG